MRIRMAVALLIVISACSREKQPLSQRVVASPEATTTSSARPTTSPTASPSETSAAVPTSTVSPQRAAPDLAKAHIKLTRLATFSEPVAMAIRKDDKYFYIVEKGGRIRQYRDGVIGATVLDISSEVSTGTEQGLLGLAFSSDGNRMYVYFTSKSGSGPAGDDVLRQYTYSNGRVGQPHDLFRISDPESNHNGGNVMFGPDGHLYIGTGDGGGGGDQHGAIGNGQDKDSLLGKILRIDPTSSGSYTIPSDNPFASGGGRKEIWAYGLRNPWRWSFDRASKDLWIGDVGQGMWEEIDFQPANSDGGDNYGWRRMEGNHSFNGGTAPPDHHRPIYEYSHDGGNCSVTGGYVYRGSRIRDLYGAYLFGDFCVGELRAFTLRNRSAAANSRFLDAQVDSLSSFGEDRAGELYVMSLSGGFYRIDPA